MRKIIFHNSHMIDTRPGGLIIITRFLDDARQVFKFNNGLWGKDALEWGKRWVEKVVY